MSLTKNSSSGFSRDVDQPAAFARLHLDLAFVGEDVGDDALGRFFRRRLLRTAALGQEQLHADDQEERARQHRGQTQDAFPPSGGHPSRHAVRLFFLGRVASGAAPECKSLQRLGRRAIALRLVLDHQFLNDVGQVVAARLPARGRSRAGAGRRRVPHHPGDLPVAAERAQPGKERLELAPAHQLVGRETQRVQVAGRADRAELVRDQFGGHVLGRALQQAAFLVAGAAGQAEIAQLHPVRGRRSACCSASRRRG